MKTNLRYCLSLLLICLLLSACEKDDKVQYYTIDQNESGMEWKGYLKDGGGNNGTISLKGKLFAAEPGEITGGQISLPLSSLININRPTDELKQQLVHHKARIFSIWFPSLKSALTLHL